MRRARSSETACVSVFVICFASCLVSPLVASQAARAAECARRGRVCSEHLTERALQRAEPGLIVAPVIDTLAKDRLAHLLRAGSAHGAIVLVKTQTPLIERKAAVLEQSTHLGLGVGDQG